MQCIRFNSADNSETDLDNGFRAIQHASVTRMSSWAGEHRMMQASRGQKGSLGTTKTRNKIKYSLPGFGLILGLPQTGPVCGVTARENPARQPLARITATGIAEPRTLSASRSNGHDQFCEKRLRIKQSADLQIFVGSEIEPHIRILQNPLTRPIRQAEQEGLLRLESLLEETSRP